MTAITHILDWLKQKAPAAHLYSDSREVAARAEGGAVFMAYPGDEADGRAYIEHAIQSGAQAVVYESEAYSWPQKWQIPHLGVRNLKEYAGPIAAAFYGAPDAGMRIIAVTGTNGKTSCSQAIAAALSRSGGVTAVVGTLGVGLCRHGACENHVTTGYTTPDAVMLQRRLAELRGQGVTALAIEASSIGLDQGRLNGMHVDVALFTNFTRDHLDYHGDMTAYEAAKRLLFDWRDLKHAVINLDDPLGLSLAEQYRGRLTLTGYTLNGVTKEGVSVLSASHIRTRGSGTEFHVESPFGKARVQTNLVGHFNVSNALGVLGVLLTQGWGWDQAVDAIAQIKPAPGRMQRLGGKDTPMVVIDYAHTPDALEKALSALRVVANERQGQLWCVFGCGGDRDPGKRPQMGAIAEEADHVVVTSDNPRNEDPLQIMAQIVAGMKTASAQIEDRAAAILQTLKQADNRDVVLIAGKGHEAYQEVKGSKYPFDDADHAALALAARATMRRDG